MVLAKEGTVRMNSETVGLGDAYDETVHDSIRLTWSGMYAHAAPWNAAFFGTVAPNDGFGDWNVGWDQWRQKSALR
ncbi:hypothetical protein SAMN05216252_12315 [Actinacidiphila glaucinigra]|uniref:Uncharacterized protein n=1 Tax=Actinacidiphila glaucinigra TaxID=235986 RepID=A0A239M795_9ACTN|nr:hypothetical protein SAMN05216252_12315 [Actinacidiphila glaucinigra]